MSSAKCFRPERARRAPAVDAQSSIDRSTRCTIAIVGVDEAGRGPLAGPVAAGACLLTARERYPRVIADSKQLTPAERERGFRWIATHCRYGFGLVAAEVIDEIGILAATQRAMQMAVSELSSKLGDRRLLLLVDGRDRFHFDHPHVSIVRGDETERCISGASIVAKVLRDRIMCAHAKKFPQYGFEHHKGYGTTAHIAAIRKHGLCPLHRRTFVRNLMRISTSKAANVLV